MTKVTVDQQFQTNKYLIVSRKDEEDNVITSKVVVSDENTNVIRVVNIEQGPQGIQGVTGAQGVAGQDATQFTVLPISSGGTNNTTYSSGNIIVFDGQKLSSSSHSVQDVLDQAALASNAVTGILVGSGLSKTDGTNNVTVNVELGEGLEISASNEIKIDGTIARTSELDLGSINGQVPISKGGTNNNFFTQNKLVYFDGSKIKSFPINTGNFVFSGVNVDIVAGSGLIGGGALEVPNGSVVINIPSSADIFVQDNDISLSVTGTPGTYSKVVTDSKGRVTSGTNLTESDILSILGYTPFHLGNDGAGSNLDADLLDGEQGSYYTDSSNLTGTISTSVLPSAVVPGNYTKVGVDANGLVTTVLYADQADIISSLGYTPVPTTGTKTISGKTTLANDVDIGGELSVYDNLPLLSTNSPNILPDTPRGVSFIYGGAFSTKTGMLAYYPAADELKLVTNMFASGVDIDGDGTYGDDLNGGDADSVFVLQNLNGDQSTILLRNIADSLYVKKTTDESINGLKTFVDGITVKGKINISPNLGVSEAPFELYGNTNVTPNLNADLLDGKDGTDYRDAAQVTGAFSYDNVTFDHIQGTHNYIPKFNDTTNDPANRIDSSSIQQDSNNDIIVDSPNNLSMGTGNLTNGNSSISVGPNIISGTNTLAVGSHNTTLGSNSVALNQNSVARGLNSLAMGRHGETSLPNQIAVGAFNVNDTSGVRLEHGQYTSVNMHLQGAEIGNSWTNLSPSIIIPNNKTIGYQAEVLVTKAFGTGVAHFKLESGIFKNATFRNSNNLVEVINKTQHPQVPKKNEIFNNSQIKNHYHTFEHTNGVRATQDIKVREPPLISNSVRVENLKNNYRYTKLHKSVSGIYTKTNDGNLVLDVHNPVYSGNFLSDTQSRGIKISLDNHGVAVNSLIDLKFSNIQTYNVTDGLYKVYSVIDKNNFFVERPMYTGYLSYYEGSTVDYAKVMINSGSMPDQTFVSSLLDIADKIYVDTPSEGVQLFNMGNKNTENDYNNQSSLSISHMSVSKRSTYPTGVEVTLIPLTNNSGSILSIHKEDIAGTFSSLSTDFAPVKGVYRRKANTNNVEIFAQDLTRINLPHTPLDYELTSGYLDDDNDQFEIVNHNDQHFLQSRYAFDYETKNIYYVRVKAIDRSKDKFKEQSFTITVNNTRSPYSLASIPDQTIDISETFSYTVPAEVFNEEVGEGSLTYSATQQNGNALPSWLSFNAGTRTFTGNPGGCNIGTYNIRVYAENNYNSIHVDFFLTVTDEAYQSLEAELSNNLDITGLSISSSSLDENLPSGARFAKFDFAGSYLPYCEFSKSYNNFTGVLVSGLDFFEARNISYDFPTVSLSGDVSLLPVSGLLDNSNLPDDSRVVRAYGTFALSGTPGLTDRNIYLTNGYNDNDAVFFSGMKVNCPDTDRLPPFFTVESVGDYFFRATSGLTDVLAAIDPDGVDNLIIQPTGQYFDSSVPGSDIDYLLMADKLSTNVSWASGYPNCTDKDLIGNTTVSYTDRTGDPTLADVTTNLDNFNSPPTGDLKRANIKYGSDTFSFRDSIENPVLGLYAVGSSDFCTLLLENNDSLTAENSDDIISDNDAHHGTRIGVTQSYELFDTHNVVKANGKLMLNTFDSFVAENGDPIVHDYAIAARSGDVALLFPGTRQGDIVLTYPDSIDLSDTVFNYYYNWGKLIPFSFTNDKNFVKINKIYSGIKRTTKIRHSQTPPQAANYNISGLKQHSYTIQSGDCPTDVSISGFKGFDITENTATSYSTGLVNIYTVAGTGETQLDFSKDINLDSREINNINLHTVASSNASLDLPIIASYNDASIVDADSVKIKNYFYMPESGINGNGTFTANLDQNHGYVEENSRIINRLPIEFINSKTTLSGINSVSGYRPKDYVFDVQSINGNKITVKDDKNYFLKETNRPDYFEQALKGSYLTNGIGFSGSLFHNDSNIYDVRYHFNNILNKNLVTFEYNYVNKLFSFLAPSGFIKEFDEISITFPPGFKYSNTVLNSLITHDNIKSAESLNDLEPNKDSVLLETSKSIDPNAGLSLIHITGLLIDNTFDINGTCFINNNIPNRLDPGFLVNHSGSTIPGYEINSFISGFSFSGVIPKDHNVLSSNLNTLLSSEHETKASVFATGSNLFYSGVRLLRQATVNDIGFSEYYVINKSHDIVGGLGNPDLPYTGMLSAQGTNANQNKSIEFVYLGQNSNVIRLGGGYYVSGTNNFKIYKTTFGEQINIFRSGLNTVQNIPDVLFAAYGNDDSFEQDLLDLSIPVNRFDKIKIEMNIPNDNAAFPNRFHFTTYPELSIDAKPFVLESNGVLNTGLDYLPYINPEAPSLVYTPNATLDANDCVDCTTNLPQYIPSISSNYSILDKHDYHILPVIKTNNKYCGLTYDKNKHVFFNGNIIKVNSLDTVKSYLAKDDELEILAWNNNPITSTDVTKYIHKYNVTEENTTISGISIEGTKTVPPQTTPKYKILFQDEHRFNKPFGVTSNELLSREGVVQFIKSTSGSFNLYDYNNIHYHTYGGTSSNFPLDSNGIYVTPPQTGTYTVSHNEKLCESGTLCVIVSGYNISAFTGIPDLRDRRTFGESPNNIDVNGVKGRIRPFGVDKKMYFDFIDGFSAISDDYYIEDLIAPDVISINIPYNADYVGKSGLVYVIDSDQNIKSHLNPNLDNAMVMSNGVVGSFAAANKKIFNYFDHDTKRWKHTVHFKDNQVPYNGYDITLNGESTKFLSINPNTIKLSGIEYSFDAINPTFTGLINNSLTIPSNVAEVKFRVVTLDGDQDLFSSNAKHSTPRVSMSGIGSYNVEFDEPGNYGYHGSGWAIGLEWRPPAEDFTNRETTLKISDFTGSTTQALTISKFLVPEITPSYTGYAPKDTNWQLTFDVSNIDVDSKLIANQIMFTLSNAPVSDQVSVKHKDDTSIVYSGAAGSTTGTYYPQLVLTDITTSPFTPLATGTGSIVVLDHISDKPSFDLQVNNKPVAYYLDIEQQERIKFQVPAILGPTSSEVLDNFSITLNHNANYELALYSSTYNSNTQRFDIELMPQNTGNSNYYSDSASFANQSASVSFKQPVYDSFGNYTYQTYSKSFGFNVVTYKPVQFGPIASQKTGEFGVDAPWTLDFYVLSGICEHNENQRPNVRVFDTPNMGIYGTNPIEYDTTYTYDSSLKRWKVQIISRQDMFDNYIDTTGLHPISIYIEDDLKNSTSNYEYSIKYTGIKEFKNVIPDIYTTPNNHFFTKADSLDLNENNLTDDISFPGSLKENSISLSSSNTTRRYDRDLKLWQNSYMGDRMDDKFDVRLNTNGSTLSVQCKGIGKDKIIAVAKFDAIEIESNELQGLPLTITGIAGFESPIDSGILVNQGTETWELEFKTIGGLAHANYPPTIRLTNMPTACSGFDPLIDTQMQCITSEPTWNPNDRGGSWSYSFSGVPSCTLLGVFDFNILAIDTNTGLLPASPYLPDTDSVDFRYTYRAGQFSGQPPQIVPSPLYQGMDVMKPLCGPTLYKKQADFGPSEAGVCEIPTGIKSFSVSGSLPSGLSYSLYFPEPGETPVEPYSNLGSGYILIEGYPTEFASGGTYAEQLTLNIVDARNLTDSMTFTFVDTSTPNDPDIGISVYFENDQAVLSPKAGSGFVLGSSTNWRPPPIEEATTCNSRLPHNRCGVVNIIYSGSLSADTKVYMLEPEDDDTANDLSVGDSVYLKIEDVNNDDLNGSYKIQNNSTGKYIDAGISPTIQATGLGKVVVGERDNVDLAGDWNNFFNGNIIDSLSSCLLGGAQVGRDSTGSDAKVGLKGMLVPTFTMNLSGTTPLSTSDTLFSGVKFDRINSETDIISKASWSDCWQTGNVYLSGVVVPPVHAEIVDPPPAQDYFFSFNGSRFALATRLSLGESEVQRLLTDNQRTGSLKYILEDLVGNSGIQSGTIGAGSSFDTETLTTPTGTVYKITIEHEAGNFPTFSHNTLPADKNEYIWAHKGDILTTIPTQSTFSPVITAGFDSLSAVNSLTDSDANGQVMAPVIGIAIGGYIPDDAGIGQAIPYNYSGVASVSGAWTTEDFLPNLSGIIQKPLIKTSITGIDASYSTVTDIVTIQTTGAPAGSVIGITLRASNGNLLETKNLLVEAANIDSTNLIYTNTDLSTTNLSNLSADIEFKSMIERVDTDNNRLVVRHNSLTVQSGDLISLDKNSSSSIELNLLKHSPHGAEIRATSGVTNNLMYIVNSGDSTTFWRDGFASGDFVDVYQNINDNIKIMPYNTTFITEGKYGFQITGRSNVRENEDLIYKVCTAENSGMPVFDSATYPHVGITPQQHFNNYTLHVNKPIAIATGTVSKVGNTFTFSTSGGKRPIANYAPDVQLAAGTNDYGYCGFLRKSLDKDVLKDEYDSVNDRLNISFDLDSKYGIDWSTYSQIKIKISDETGTDEYTYTY